MKDIRELAKAKRAEMDAIKIDRDGKQDKLAKVVKKLTQAEYDALPKALQKELKDMR